VDPPGSECNEQNDGVDVNIGGRIWVCSWVDGVGWTWIPLVNSCPGVVSYMAPAGKCG
jgi:hypothetical protein